MDHNVFPAPNKCRRKRFPNRWPTSGPDQPVFNPSNFDTTLQLTHSFEDTRNPFVPTITFCWKQCSTAIGIRFDKCWKIPAAWTSGNAILEPDLIRPEIYYLPRSVFRRLCTLVHAIRTSLFWRHNCWEHRRHQVPTIKERDTQSPTTMMKSMFSIWAGTKNFMKEKFSIFDICT